MQQPNWKIFQIYTNSLFFSYSILKELQENLPDRPKLMEKLSQPADENGHVLLPGARPQRPAWLEENLSGGHRRKNNSRANPGKTESRAKEIPRDGLRKIGGLSWENQRVGSRRLEGRPRKPESRAGKNQRVGSWKPKGRPRITRGMGQEKPEGQAEKTPRVGPRRPEV